MTDEVRPRWIAYERRGTEDWEIQVDDNARPYSEWRIRHRPRCYSGEVAELWSPGAPYIPEIEAEIAERAARRPWWHWLAFVILFYLALFAWAGAQT